MFDYIQFSFHHYIISNIGAHLVSYVKGNLVENMDLGASQFSPISAQYKAA